jgi:hypothetical protein
VVGFLPGSGCPAAGILCHIDSFFTGACDNATGIAASARKADFYFLGLSAHHDEAAGMRDWVARDAVRLARIGQLFLLEHVDEVDSEEGRAAGWPMPLNNNRTAYLGSDGWPEVRELLPELAVRSGVMTVAPKMQDACIADLFVTCGQVTISDRGIRNAVNFHLMLLQRLKLVEMTE